MLPRPYLQVMEKVVLTFQKYQPGNSVEGGFESSEGEETQRPVGHLLSMTITEKRNGMDPWAYGAENSTEKC